MNTDAHSVVFFRRVLPVARYMVEPWDCAVSESLCSEIPCILLYDRYRHTPRQHREVSTLLSYGVPVVVVADAEAPNSAERRCTELGIKAYITRPLKLRSLHVKLDTITVSSTTRNRVVIEDCQVPARGGGCCGGTAEGESLCGHYPSAVMQSVCEEIRLYAGSDCSVVITGESGTGKDIAAREIHRLSARADGPFIALNCGAIPAGLSESSLFGSVEGAFTGARNREGMFRSAHGGTLFLDEVVELPRGAQAALLRALEVNTVRAVGADRTRSVDVRIVAATNRSLEAAVRAGVFRSDLYFRLLVFSIRMPPLRERSIDIPVLVAEILAQDCPDRDLRFSTAALQDLQRHNWPGNVRELRSVVRRSAILCREAIVYPEKLRYLQPM